MVGWNELYFKRGTFRRSQEKADEGNRGAYLVEVWGIAVCHTAKAQWEGDDET